MFFPDIIPLGHPIFDIIESTDPEVNGLTKLLMLSLVYFRCLVELAW
jgi:histone-lysine N-methyltransferase SETD3